MTIITHMGLVMPGRSLNMAMADERYKFIGKEQDVETGYGYFGGRYYDALRGQWTSADPLAEKYPGWSPYHYAADNPIIILDQNGLEWENAMQYGIHHLIGLSYKVGCSYASGGNWKVTDENSVVCNEIVARAYRGDSQYPGFADFPIEMGDQVDWFQKQGWSTEDVSKGQVGDVIFFGKPYDQGERHAMVITGVKDGKYKVLQAHHPKRPKKDKNGKFVKDEKGNLVWEDEEKSDESGYFSIGKLEEWYGTFYTIGSVQMKNSKAFQKDNSWFDAFDASNSSAPGCNYK